MALSIVSFFVLLPLRVLKISRVSSFPSGPMRAISHALGVDCAALFGEIVASSARALGMRNDIRIGILPSIRVELLAESSPAALRFVHASSLARTLSGVTSVACRDARFGFHFLLLLLFPASDGASFLIRGLSLFPGADVRFSFVIRTECLSL